MNIQRRVNLCQYIEINIHIPYINLKIQLLNQNPTKKKSNRNKQIKVNESYISLYRRVELSLFETNTFILIMNKNLAKNTRWK